MIGGDPRRILDPVSTCVITGSSPSLPRFHFVSVWRSNIHAGLRVDTLMDDRCGDSNQHRTCVVPGPLAGLTGTGKSTLVRSLLLSLPSTARVAVCVHQHAKSYGLETTCPFDVIPDDPRLVAYNEVYGILPRHLRLYIPTLLHTSSLPPSIPLSIPFHSSTNPCIVSNILRAFRDDAQTRCTAVSVTNNHRQRDAKKCTRQEQNREMDADHPPPLPGHSLNTSPSIPCSNDKLSRAGTDAEIL